ncbi:MAG: TonB-dependent receptor, partial [Panacibacter sp.]
KDSSGFTLQAGLRYNYNTLNKEFLVSPRVGFSFKPASWKKDIVIRGAAGVYVQPPFYREMRRFDGSLNYNLKSQKSIQVSGGFDYNFKLFQRPARLTTEAYYKHLTDVVPYDIDNVRIRYYGENAAKAYAAGIEARLFGEIVKDAESWISIGIMRTKEDLNNDYYTTYKNVSGEIIGPATPDKIPADSASNSIGWLRRPTDRLITFGMFFQDYLSTNKNFKVYLNTLYGSNLPYNIPGNARYRNALFIEPYIRVDMGFSALLLNAQSNRRSHSPFKNFENIWASLEIFNVVDRANTISYQLIKDFSNTTYTIPNRLTPRLLNFKIIARW